MNRIVIGAVAWCTAAAAVLAQTMTQPARSVTDPGVITTRQTITPAGVQTVFDGRVYGVTFGDSGDELWVLAGVRGGGPSVYRLDWRENRVKDRWQLQGTAALQGLTLDPATKTPLVGADGSRIAVATLLGVGSGSEAAPARRYVHAYRGTVSVRPVPDHHLASYTTAVAENNRIATARGRTVRVYGEFAGRLPSGKAVFAPYAIDLDDTEREEMQERQAREAKRKNQ